MRRALAAALLALPVLAAAASPRRPHFASIGDIQIDRRAWTVKGRGVDVSIDHEAGRITGRTWGGCVDLKVDYSADKVSYAGTPACGNMRYTVRYDNGTAEGQHNGKHLAIEFNDAAQTLSGSYGGQPFEGTIVKTGEDSWVLTGRMNGHDVSMPVVNAGILELVEHLYLFLKP